MTGPTSPSSSGALSPKARGCLRTVLVVVVLVVVVLVGGRACNSINHSMHGRKINQMGTDLLGVLDSYGPIAPAEGSRSQSNGVGSELFPRGSDPGRYYTYGGGAEYTIEARDEGQKTPEEAYDAFIAYLEADGWDNWGYSDTFKAVIFGKGDWTISVYSTLDEEPGSVSFGIDSPDAGGFVLPTLF